MNVLPILLLAYALGGNKARSIAEFLSHVDFKSFAPILKILGVSDKLLEILCSDEFSSALSGELNARSIVSLLSGLSPKSEQKNDDAENSASPPKKSNFLSPIENVAPTEIEQSLGTYFA